MFATSAGMSMTPRNGIAPGTKFEDLPADWVCPLCSVDKTHFEKQ